ncbi:hypothetical protein WMC41_31110 (plasmid) [Shinella yambaruensis]|uniref:hypothetical protein n=1 Tax=Shinella TaxID=323620 RepID=UPI00258C767D|nr:hypothetical protein [Shinella sp.]MCW5712360.1 hypothetical protein [Shinella sp.]
MKPAHPVVTSNLRKITGQVRPMALANAIHFSFPSSWGGAFFITLNNIRDCIHAGDRWFEEQTPEGFRVSTDSGFSCIVRERPAFSSVPHAATGLVTASEAGCQPTTATAPEGGDAWLPGALATIAKAEGRPGCLNPPPTNGRERMLDALQRAERFMSGFEDDPLQEGIDDDLGEIRSAIADLEDGAATSTEKGPDHE